MLWYWYPNVVGTQHPLHIKINCSSGFHLYFQTQKCKNKFSLWADDDGVNNLLRQIKNQTGKIIYRRLWILDDKIKLL